MTYTQRLATPNDICALALLWKEFAHQYRSQVDSSMELIPDFDYEQYLSHQLVQPLSFCFVLEYDNNIVGFLAIYIYHEAEAPPSNLPPGIDIIETIETIDSPFKLRPVSGVLACYVQKQHGKVDTIKDLIEEANKTIADQDSITQKEILALFMLDDYSRTMNMNTFQIYFSKRDGTFNVLALIGDQYQHLLRFNPGAEIFPGDYNGDGKTDFIRQEHGSWDDTINTFQIYFSKGD